MRHARKTALTFLVAFSILLTQTACPKSETDRANAFAKGVRVAIAISPALIDSLVASGAIPASAKGTYVKDGTDLGNGSATLAEDMVLCADKSCRLGAVDKFQAIFFEVVNRGNFIKVGKLAKVQSILEVLIASARVYFGAVAKRGETYRPVDELLKELKAEMETR